LVAIDPGRSTGFVDITLDEDGPGITHAAVVSWDDRFSLEQLIYGREAMANGPPDAIVVESFRLFANKAAEQVGEEFPSVRVIGLVELVAHQHNHLDRIFFQQPAVRKRIQIKEPFKSQLPKSPHARDAFQHARYYWIMKLGVKI